MTADDKPTTALVPVAAAAVAVVDPSAPDPAAIYLARMGSPGSRATMHRCLLNIGRIFNAELTDLRDVPWHLFTYDHVVVLRSRIAAAYAFKTANLHLCALRGVMRVCGRLGIIPRERVADILEIEPVKGTRLPAGRMLEERELAALSEACARDQTPRGRRDAALLAVLHNGGLRREEAVRLGRDDVNPATGEIRVLRGKGNKQRLVYANSPGALEAIRVWCDVRGDEPGAFFCRTSPGSGAVAPGCPGMKGQAIYDILRARQLETSGDASPFSPHDMRRTFGSTLLDRGADILTVRDLLGHSSVATTELYDHRGERRKEVASRLVQSHYVEPKPPPGAEGEPEKEPER